MLRSVRENGPAFVAAAFLAVAAKAAHAWSALDALAWMATPLQALVHVLTGLPFQYEAGYGYVNLAHRVVIARSCLGVNYLLAVFAVLVVSVVPAVAGAWRKLAVLVPLALVAWTCAVPINAVRIAVGLALQDSHVSLG